jgi:hypothetical protein
VKKTLWILTALMLGACASVDKIERGNQTLGERLQVVIDGPWNHLNLPDAGPAQIWTMEGITVDELLLYSGLKDGEVIHGRSQNADNAKNFYFKSSMQPHELVALWEGALTRDGSRFKLLKLEPVPFAGQAGFRFEFELTRKFDNVQLRGLGYGTVSKGELFALLYTAPRLTFFARHRNRVERMAQSAKLKD